MQWLAEVCVRRPVFASVLTLMIMVLGIAGYYRLGVDQFPDIDLPVITVTTILPGASPEDMETDVTEKIEAAVNTIGNIDELRSISREGVSLVIISFNIEKDIDVASQDVRDRVNRVLRDLPQGIEQPQIAKLDPSASPILYVALQAPGRSTTEITRLAEGRLKESLEIISGVGQVQILGGRARAFQVQLDPVRLKSLGIGVGEVARAIGAQNLTVPGGRIDTGPQQLTLRIQGRVNSVDELAQLPIRTTSDRVIHVGDVASLLDGMEEEETRALWNGQPALLLAIRKQAGANTLKVTDSVKEQLEEMRKELPGGYIMEVVRDNSGPIRTGTDGVKEHLVVGAILAALVVLLFLGNFRSTIIAAIAIPTSVLGTFAVMSALGYTLNVITLLALALSVGIVIDDAIVVLENIFRYVEEKGRSPMQAAVEGTEDIGLAVLATTFSLIAVFLPVVFLAGIPGRFLRSFGVTMTVAIVVSLFVSFSLTPMLASRWLKKPVHGQEKGALEKLVDIFYRPIERLYLSLLGFCLRHRWVVVLAAVGSLATIPVLGGMAKKSFLPEDDRARFEVVVRAPEGDGIESTAIYAERLAQEIRRMDGVELTLTTVGDEADGDNVARIYVGLVDPLLRDISQNAFKEKVRAEVLDHNLDNLRLSVGDISDFGAGGQSSARIQYTLTGPDLKELERYAQEIVTQLKKVPGAVDVDSSLVSGKPELKLRLDRARAAELGVSTLDVANTLQSFVGGSRVSTFEESGKQYDIQMRGAPKWRSDPAALSLLMVPSTKVGSVPVTDVTQLEYATGPSTISRLSRQRSVSLSANAATGTGENIISGKLEDIAKSLGMPDSYHLRPAGQTKLLAETAISVLIGFALAFIFMYLILAAQFESWLHPFTILLSLPLTLPYALLSLVVTGQPLGMFSVLGIFVLFGIVKKNAILQIDHTNKLREHGLERLPAILQANRDRLRPILMTTLAFVAGMIPLVISEGIGSGFNKATAGVVVWGQSLSLILTLVATPVAYSIFDDILNILRRLLQRVGLLSTAEET